MKKSITILIAIMVVSLINAGCGSETANKDANEKDSTSIVTDSIKIVAEKTVEKVTIKMYTRSGEIFEQKCESKLLFFEKSGVVKAIGHNCENEYGIFDYYDGTISALKMEGKVSNFDNCGGSGEGPTMCLQNKKFAMQLKSDSTILKIDELNYSMSKVKFSFKTNGLKIYESPSFDSKIIEEIKIKNDSIELLEVGNLEKKNGEWDVWYKVKSKNKEGWCFGNLIF